MIMADEKTEVEGQHMEDERKEGEGQLIVQERKEGEVIPSRGDWEVVSLTGSTFDATSGTKEHDPKSIDDDDENNQEPSNALFLSGHFVFPPSEHENLPIEPDVIEMYKETDTSYIFDDEETEEVDESFDEVVYEEEKEMYGSDLIDYSESTVLGDTLEYRSDDADSPKNMKPSGKNNFDGTGHPCAAWLKKHASSLYCHAKEANAFWSIVVAAALTGLVILGKRWHKDKWHGHEFRGHLIISDEKMKSVVGPIGRLKNIIVGSHQHGSVVGGGVSASH